MNDSPTEPSTGTPPTVGPAFLLSQLGFDAAYAFAERLAPLGLTPRHVGILRMLAHGVAPWSQIDLARALNVVPSVVVGLLDELSERALVARHRSPTDRRANHLVLTDAGRALFAEVEALTAGLDDTLFGPPDDPDRRALEALLRRLAERRGLRPGAHPAWSPPP